MMSGKRFQLPLALLLGLASALAFEPVGWWPLMPLAFTGLAALVAAAPSLRRGLLVGWLFGLGQFVLGLNWIATAFTFQAAMPAWLGYVAVVLLSLYLAVYPALATGLAWRFGQRSPLALVLSLMAGWGLSEFLRATMFTGFAWNPVGVTLVDTALRTDAAHIGTYGMSMLVVGIGGALFLLARREARAAFFLLLGISALVTFHEGEDIAPRPQGSERAVRIVQPNIGQEEKWRPGFADEAAQRLASLSASPPANDRPRLLLWPEAAVVDAMVDERAIPLARQLADFERRRAAAALRRDDLLVTGGIAFFSENGRTITSAGNSVFVLDPQSRILARYDKSHLVPYGEYLPMRPLLSAIGLSRLAPGDVDFRPGPGPQTIALPGWGRMGLQICYEIIFSGHVVDAANRPDFLFNPSNDAWFGAWGPPQHLAQARLRAAEEGLPVLRSTPTGISAVIDAHGTLTHSLPWKTAGIIDADLPVAIEPTPFARAGNILPLGLAFLLLILAIGMDARRRYRRDI